MIKITLKDGSVIEAEQGITVLDVAKKITEGLARIATAGTVSYTHLTQPTTERV